MKNKVTRILCAAVVGVAALFGGLLLQPVQTSAETLSSTVYQTGGASVRVFKKGENGYESTDKQGIRFHVEMGANYAIDGTTLLDTNTLNDKNGSYTLAAGYKTYTLVLPTRLLPNNIELTVTTPKVMKIDTSEYWFSDEDGNWESVAYIYNIPSHRYTDNFTFRGIICSVDEDGNETVVKSTQSDERALTYVAKRAYEDTIDETTNYWGTAELDEQAAPLIAQFIPKYTVEYADGTTETVLWGDTLQSADANATYYDETNNRVIDVTQPLKFAESCSIKLAATQEHTFSLTGVEYTADGFNVYATLPTSDFSDGTILSPSAIVMQTSDGKAVSAKSVTVSVIGDGNDAKNKLVMTFDYTDISNGTKLTISSASNFYNNGILYRLESDYTFTYENENWSLPLGTISHGDIKEIANYTEEGANGTERNIRIYLNSDFLINDTVSFKDGGVTVTRQDGTTESITDGAYYWNQGNDKVLELDHNNRIWGEHDGDVLTIQTGTKLVQNNGYYVFAEEITATYNGSREWVFEKEENKIDASAFTKTVFSDSNADDGNYVDIKTQSSWADKLTKIVVNGGEIKYTPLNGTPYTVTTLSYHGENSAAMLRLCGLSEFSKTGDTFTLPNGLQFWLGNKVYELTEDVEFYCVQTPSQTKWVANPTFVTVGTSDIKTIYWYQDGNGAYQFRYTTVENWSSIDGNNVYVDATKAATTGLVCKGTNYGTLYYYGGTNNVLEIRDTKFDTSGGSVVIEKDTVLWLFSGYDGTFVSAYRFTEDVSVLVSGNSGSLMYQDVEIAKISAKDVTNVANYTQNNEIRFTLDYKTITFYGNATLEGSATLDGTSATGAYVYGYNNGYTGNNIFSVRGIQATQKGQKVVVAAGTKLWLEDASGYITIADELSYTFNGSDYTDSNMEYPVTVTAKNATVSIASTTVKVGEKLTFTVTPNAGYTLNKVTGATLVSGNTYTTDAVYAGLTIEVVAVKRIEIKPASVKELLLYTNDGPQEIRMYLDQDTITDLKSISGQGAMTADATVTGTLGTPTGYTYYGVVGGTSHQIFGITLPNAPTTGKTLTLAKGSTFIYGDYQFYIAEDFAIEYIAVTATYDVDVFNLVCDGTNYKNLGDGMLQFSGSTHTIAVGWVGSAESTYYLKSMIINGEAKDTKGTYQGITAKDGKITIEVTTAKKTFSVTWTSDHVKAVKVSNVKISSGDRVEIGTEIVIECSNTAGYWLESITVNGTTPEHKDNATELYKYTVQSDTVITVTNNPKTADEIANSMVKKVDSNSKSTVTDGKTVIESNDDSATIVFGLDTAYLQAAKDLGFKTLTITVKADNNSFWGLAPVSTIVTDVGSMGTVSKQTATLTITLADLNWTEDQQTCVVNLTAKRNNNTESSSWTITVGTLSK